MKHPSMNRLQKMGLCAAALVLALSWFLPALQASAESLSQRIVAIGDVHGDLDALLGILQKAEILDSNTRWAGGNATLVVTGDFLDRGPQFREVMDFLMELEKEAPRQQGQVVVLLGNHEAMNIMGDLRYVIRENYASFAEANSEAARHQAYQSYVKLLQRRARDFRQPAPALTPEFERQWMETHPPGFIEQRKALSRKGRYGAWLREHQPVARIGDIIFLHGGIHPKSPYGSWKVKDINTRIQDEIRWFDQDTEYMADRGIILPFFTLEEIISAAIVEMEFLQARVSGGLGLLDRDLQHARVLERFLNGLQAGRWLSVHPEGPLWFRGFAQWPEDAGALHLAELLKTHQASHFVVGHTVQMNDGVGAIQGRFGGKVFLIDTGMLSSYYPGGRASALEIQNGKFTAIYMNQRNVLLQRQARISARLEELDGAG